MAPGDLGRDRSPSNDATLGAQALAQGGERYASMFTHHPHATYSVDPDGYFTDANERTLEMTGLTLDELRQAHFAQVIHPEDLPAIQEGFEGALAGEPQVVDARVVSADGEHTDIRCTAIPVIVGGEVVGVHGVSEDVTEAKRVLRELEEANAAKSLFLATVAHEVRTPLAALIGASELLLDTDLAPEPAHFAQIVHRSGDRLLHLLQEILDFSGLEAHQTVLRRGPVDLREIFGEVSCWAGQLAEAKGVSTTIAVADDVPLDGTGDARRIRQVVTNIVENAITFTERGSVDVHVSARPSGDDVPGGATWIDVRVRDTGIGIARDDLGTLFGPFVQVGPQPAGDRLGVGLGLAIARELAALMDGRLEVESTPGEGSTFTFGFPLPVA
ncbi:HAMP domain-containing sensor histidine kinase [Nocardioides sp. zg-1230]|uniref:sensor histidine kinase n=1 Tax=Nocardioides sp. zg-1230 TaxID=2736601 RepID=UPI001552BE0D|nr:PAS domain-containing sensor histidine kinase [Nocardioides sp. zg-1230]NPC42581.1 PAS domain S-box protein [Nocardioides sp. zg-1230]